MHRVQCSYCSRKIHPGSLKHHIGTMHFKHAEAYAQQRDANREQKRESRKSRPACPYCTKSYATKYHLEAHISKSHQTTAGLQRRVLHYCWIWDVGFTTEERLVRHLRQYHEPRKCPDCSAIVRGNHSKLHCARRAINMKQKNDRG